MRRILPHSLLVDILKYHGLLQVCMDSIELEAKFISLCISALASHSALRGASRGRIHLVNPGFVEAVSISENGDDKLRGPQGESLMGDNAH